MCELPTIEDFQKLQKEVADLKSMLLIAEIYMPQVVTIADICKAERISKTQISTKERYLLPNFGISEFEGKIRWNLSTYLNWRNIPLAQRKAMYAEFLEQVRKDNLRA